MNRELLGLWRDLLDVAGVCGFPGFLHRVPGIGFPNDPEGARSETPLLKPLVLCLPFRTDKYL